MTILIDKVKSGPSRMLDIQVESRLTAIDMQTRSADDGELVEQNSYYIQILNVCYDNHGTINPPLIIPAEIPA